MVSEHDLTELAKGNKIISRWGRALHGVRNHSADKNKSYANKLSQLTR